MEEILFFSLQVFWARTIKPCFGFFDVNKKVWMHHHFQRTMYMIRKKRGGSHFPLKIMEKLDGSHFPLKTDNGHDTQKYLGHGQLSLVFSV